MTTRKKTDAEISFLSLKYDCLFERGFDPESRRIQIVGDIDGQSFASLDAAMTELENQNGKAITIVINSEGGNTRDAMAIVGRLRSSKCRIITQGFGSIESAATLILACGDKRQISKYAWFMYHESSYDAKGRHSSVKNQVLQEELEEQRWAEWMEDFTFKDAGWWLQQGELLDRYLGPEELITFGVADEIL